MQLKQLHKWKSTGIGEDMNQPDLFDGKRSESLKQRGMDLAADNCPSPLQLARDIAEEICLTVGVVSADGVGRLMKKRHGIDTLGPAAGSIFKEKRWKWTGQWIKSKRVSNHSRMLRVWTMR